MNEAPESPRALTSRVGLYALGGLAGGVLGALVVIGVTLVLKAGMDFFARQATWLVVAAPLVGLAAAVVALHVLGRSAPRSGSPDAQPYRTFPPEMVRADITGEVVATAGCEERFRWRLLPIRALAILATVGSGGAMGTEAPAAYFGVGVGAWLGDRRASWRRLLRPAAIGGGAGGVAALIGIALVGTGYVLEVGRRNQAPINAERLIAGLIGGVVGWALNAALHVNLFFLVVPKEPPDTFLHALEAALFIGAMAGCITSLANTAIYRVKKWRAAPIVRLALGGLGTLVILLSLVAIAGPRSATGPGGGAILWAENSAALPMTLLAVALLRAGATTAAAAAGGSGGLFVPYLAIGDLAGRVFAPGLGVGGDLAGVAGSAGGIAGGYRLPFTALAMVFGVAGPILAKLTEVGAVVVAFFAAVATDYALERIKGWSRRTTTPEPPSRRRGWYRR